MFCGLSMLDSSSVRESVVRIPEVLSRIKKAQKTIDQLSQQPVDLINFMMEDDASFASQLKLRRVLVNVVQLGLYDRHLKSFPKPQFFVGSLSNLSTMEHCIGLNFMEELVRSLWYQDLEQTKITNFYVYEHAKIMEDTFETRKIDEDESKEAILSRLIRKGDVKQFANLGPADVMLDPYNNAYIFEDIQVFNTIEVDPMLNWFKPIPIQYSA